MLSKHIGKNRAADSGATAGGLRAAWAALLVLGVLCSAARAKPQGEVDPIVDLSRWTERYSRARRGFDEEQRRELERRVADARMLALAVPERRQQAVVALLELAATRSNGRAVAELPGERSGQAAEVRALALASAGSLLAAAGGEELASWIALSVLAGREPEGLGRRIAAAELLEGRYLPATKLGLFGAALAPERELREAATLALNGWPDDSVHRFLLDQLRRTSETPGWVSPRIVREHFTLVELQPGTPATAALRAHLRAALEGHDWRAAYRALQLAPALSDEDAVPILLDGLERWSELRKVDAGRLRLEGDLVTELRRRSGRNIGLHVVRWRSWWTSHQARRTRDGGVVEAEELTHAEFFGLRPVTDRVVFVLDRSGSMDFAFSGGDRTRYEEAIAQLMGLLRGLGEGTRFRVILFSGETLVWSHRLKPASKANLSAVEAWIRSRKPRGNTRLRPGVEEAMRLDHRGRVDLKRLEADTVIVVCDGQTQDGPSWVGPLLETAGEEACLTFHGVQIGNTGDGTLERLAEGSGGEFVLVAP